MILTEDLKSFLETVDIDILHRPELTVTEAEDGVITLDGPSPILGDQGVAMTSHGVFDATYNMDHGCKLNCVGPQIGDKIKVVFFNFLRRGKGFEILKNGKPKSICIGDTIG